MLIEKPLSLYKTTIYILLEFPLPPLGVPCILQNSYCSTKKAAAAV